MIAANKLEVGDILQYKVRGKNDFLGHFINFMTLGGNYSHTAMYIGRGKKVEAHAKELFGATPLLKEDYPYIDIYRTKKRLSRYKKEWLLEEAKNLYGREYDELGLIGTIRSGLGSLLNWDWLRQSRPFFNDLSKYYCSEAIAEIYQKGVKIDIVPKVSGYVTTPNDISRSEVLYKVNK